MTQDEKCYRVKPNYGYVWVDPKTNQPLVDENGKPVFPETITEKTPGFELQKHKLELIQDEEPTAQKKDTSAPADRMVKKSVAKRTSPMSAEK